MRWPWQKPETRNYSDTITASFVAAAEGGVDSAPLATAALEIASGLYARCLGAAQVDGPEAFKRALTPIVLAQIGRDLIRAGESFFLITVRNGNVVLTPQASVTVFGSDANQMNWSYVCSEYGPTDSLTRTVPASRLLHFRFATDRSRPWQGVPPWSWSSATGEAVSGLENILSREARAPHGSILALPSTPQIDQDGNEQPLNQFRSDLAGARGKTLLIENPNKWENTGSGGPAKAVDSFVFGFDRSLIANVRSGVGRDLLAACGISASLFESSSDGTGQREAFRRFLHTGIQPMANLLQTEFALKLDDAIKLDLSAIWAADVAGRSRAFKQLTEAGLSKEEAAQNTGIRI